jgi:hypothetical protein
MVEVNDELNAGGSAGGGPKVGSIDVEAGVEVVGGPVVTGVPVEQPAAMAARTTSDAKAVIRGVRCIWVPQPAAAVRVCGAVVHRYGVERGRTIPS